jgi:hypothetical protein
MHAIIPAIDIIAIRTVFIVDVHGTHPETLSGCLDHLYDLISSAFFPLLLSRRKVADSAGMS